MLGGRTIWNATALPTAQASADMLRGRLKDAGGDFAVATRTVSTSEPLRRLAERVDAMMVGGRTPVGRVPLGRADQDLYYEALAESEALVGREIAPDDVVVMHDPLVALLARAVRERGAHAVFRLRVGPGTSEPLAREARAFLRRFTDALDAYVSASPRPVGHGARGERIAAVMPARDSVAAKDLPREREPVAWSCVLADVVLEDRDERVGGRLHARPVVAPR